MVWVGSCFFFAGLGKERNCQVTPKIKTSKKGCRSLWEKWRHFVPRKHKLNIAEECTASHIEMGTAVTELAKYVLQGYLPGSRTLTAALCCTWDQRTPGAMLLCCRLVLKLLSCNLADMALSLVLGRKYLRHLGFDCLWDCATLPSDVTG